MKKEVEKEMEQMQAQVFTETCQKCGKVMRSLNKKELAHNFAVHKLSCKGKK